MCRTPWSGTPDRDHRAASYRSVRGITPRHAPVRVSAPAAESGRELALAPVQGFDQRLHGLVMQAPGIICILEGLEHRIEFANTACVRMLGDRALLGLTAREAFPDLIDPGILDRVYASGECCIVDGRSIVQPDSRDASLPVSVFDFAYAPTRDALGRVVGIFVEGHEVTQRVRAETALTRSEAKYRSLFDSIDEGFCILQVVFDESESPIDYVYLEANEGFRRQTGIEDPVGRSVHELVPGLERFWFEAYGRVALKGESLRFVHRAATMDRWFDLYAFRIGDPSERRVAVLFTDITERTLAAEGLAAADRQRTEFLAMLAHELRNPLVPIRNTLALLDREPLTERARTALHMSQRQLRHLTRLIDDLLEISRVSRGMIALHPEPVTVQQVVHSAVESIASSLDERSQQLRILLPEEPVPLIVDPVRLAQIVENLLSNASKYSNAGGEIHVAVRAGPVAVEIVVRDEGIGIAADNLPRLFDLFMQADASIDRSRGGLGIGLALVKRLVELHGGQVEACSEGLGKGATFTVRLPLQRTTTDGPVEVPAAGR